jgi:hypothetical protein
MFVNRLIRAGAVALAIAAAAAPAAVARPMDAPPSFQLPDGFQTPDSRDAATPTPVTPTPRGIYEPMVPEEQPQPPQDIRMPDTVDAANGRGLEHSPEVVVVEAPAKAPQPAGDGMDWADIGLGAGSVTGLALIALGGTLLVVRRRDTGGQLAG